MTLLLAQADPQSAPGGLGQLFALPLAVKLVLLILLVTLLVSAATDLRSRLILNVVTFPAAVALVVLWTIAGGRAGLFDSLLGLAVFLPLVLLSLLRPQWLGMGDAKLMCVVGLGLGWPLSVAAVLGISIAGGAQSLLWVLAARLRGQERPKYVPYAVAIAAGTIGAFLLGGGVV